MADQLTELDLVKAKVTLNQVADDMFTLAQEVDRLLHALEMIVEVPNNTASHSRAVSEMVKIATEALNYADDVAY
jgi:hypothetical protein